jgi:hypothetical protein
MTLFYCDLAPELTRRVVRRALERHDGDPSEVVTLALEGWLDAHVPAAPEPTDAEAPDAAAS